VSELTRHEEELTVATEPVEAGAVRARKRTETEQVSEVVPRGIEDADIERLPVGDGDSGEIETLADGSVSVPLFEERLVITKQLVVRERVVIRKRTVTEEHRVEAELRRERIDIDGDVDMEGDGGLLENDGEQEEQDVRT
jgi:uncharacterized protein (TIGR02271 family)